MPNLFDLLFGHGARPVRRRARLRPTVDADGKPVIETVHGELIALSQDGSIDTVEILPDRFYHCGCNAQEKMGGQCAEPGCRMVSCARCFGRCSLCLLPTCLPHTRLLELGHQQPVRLCRVCYSALSRRRRVHRA